MIRGDGHHSAALLEGYAGVVLVTHGDLRQHKEGGREEVDGGHYVAQVI